MKKALSFLIAIIMAVSFSSAPFSAVAESSELVSDTLCIDNPFYAGREIPSGSIDSVTDSSTVKSYNGNKYYTSGKSLYVQLRNKLQAHTSSFTIRYLTKGNKFYTYSQISDLLDELLANATEDEISLSGTDGDYLRWQIGFLYVNSFNLDKTKDGYYYYSIKVEPFYYSTKAQENAVDKEVNKFVSSVDTDKLSDYEIIKKIHDYICSKTTYEHEADNTTFYAYSAYGALVYGKCVCQGYANAFYRLCEELGYNARIVTSKARVGNHAWNIVELDGKYYFVDVTWDDEVAENPDNFTTKPYAFFLTNYDNSQSEDNFYQHLLDGSYYDTDYFNNNYRNKFDSNDYNRSNLELLSRSYITVSPKKYTYDSKAKKPSVTVKTASGKTLVDNADYAVSYSSNTNTGIAKIKITGAGSYAGDSSHRQFYISPKTAAKPSVSSYTANSVSLKWNANDGGVTGYSVEIYSNGKWNTAANTTAASATISSLSPATVYKFRIRAYKRVSKRNIYGAYSGERIIATKPKKVKNLKLTAAKKKLTAKWDKSVGTGYQLQYSTYKNMKGAKVINITGAKNRTRAIKSLKSKKTYYVRVRAFKQYKASGKTKRSYGAWSAKKSLKCK